VENPDTINMLAYVLRAKFPKGQNGKPIDKAQSWANSIKFTPDMEEFAALVSTVNVKSVMWMLLQHRATLGPKTIVAITAYDPDPDSSGRYLPDLMIEIGPI